MTFFDATMTASPEAEEAPAQASVLGAVAADLSPLEWQVVSLARNDHPATLREPGLAERLRYRLFGGGTNPRLADPRLETLRRMAVQGWRYGYRLPVSAAAAFLQAGFTAEQLELILARIVTGALGRPGPRP